MWVLPGHAPLVNFMELRSSFMDDRALSRALEASSSWLRSWFFWLCGRQGGGEQALSGGGAASAAAARRWCIALSCISLQSSPR